MNIYSLVLCIVFFEFHSLYCHESSEIRNTESSCWNGKSTCSSFLQHFCSAAFSSSAPVSQHGPGSMCSPRCLSQHLCTPTPKWRSLFAATPGYSRAFWHTGFNTPETGTVYLCCYLELFITFGSCTLKHRLPMPGTQWLSLRLHLIFNTVYLRW